MHTLLFKESIQHPEDEKRQLIDQIDGIDMILIEILFVPTISLSLQIILISNSQIKTFFFSFSTACSMISESI